MAGNFVNYGDTSSGFYSTVSDDLVESKVEVTTIKDEAEQYYLPDGGGDNEEEAMLQVYGNNGAYDSFNLVNQEQFEEEEEDPLQDPLQLDEGEIQMAQQQEKFSLVTSPSSAHIMQLRSTPAPPPVSHIHPFALKIQRLNPNVTKPSPNGRKNGVVTIVNNTSTELHPPSSSSSSLPPSFTTITDAESIVRTFIDNCVSSRKDPRCRHRFYFTCHTVLNQALDQNLIPPEEVDSYWKKFDEWAASSASYRVGDHYMLQYRHRANDPDEDPPKPEKITRRKKSHSKLGSTSPVRLLKIMMRNLEDSVKLYVLNSKHLPLRDDLYSRVKFYQTWHKYYNAGSELFLDFYWNALVNRSIEYYDHGYGASSKSLFNKVVLPPSPRKMKVGGLPPPPEPVNISKPHPRVSSSKSSAATSPPKNLDMDRMVKLAINNCIESGKDPRASHKFYWTIHRILETVQSLNLSLKEIDTLWRKYDDWADSAYSDKTPFQIMKLDQLYNDVSELPPPAKRITPKRPEELKMAYPAGLTQLLETRVKGFILALSITDNYLRKSLKQRRLFLETYVYFVEPEWKDELIDIYWHKLLTDTIHTYKIVISNEPALPPPPLPSRSVSTSSNLVSVPKKFDMDRLIQLCINSCIESGKDPKSTHKFYWTIHRSLETVASLKLSQTDIDLLWKKYDEWAEEAFTTRRLFKLDFTYHYEYYGDVSELPPPPIKLYKPPKPLLLKRPNGLSKWLEKAVRELIVANRSSVNRVRQDLETRRRFLQTYVDYFVPLGDETDFVIDKYWRQLLSQTIDDYKLYLESNKVACDKINEEGEDLEIIEVVTPSLSAPKFVAPPTSTTSATNKNDPKIFSMDYLVKKVINSCVQSNVDPRLCHKFYWTIHRCMQESERRDPTKRTTSIQLDAIWGQYDAMASKAFLDKNSPDFKYSMLEENLRKNYNYFHDVSELPQPSLTHLVTPMGFPSIEQICQQFPNCPKSSALKKYLEHKLKQIVSKSPFVNYQNNYILNSIKARREFFLQYVWYVKDMDCEAAEKLVGSYWRRLMTETRKSLKKSASSSSSNSTSVLNGITPRPSTSSSNFSQFSKKSPAFVSAKKDEEVPCIDLD